ncbi:hypothetical protein G5V59_03440 [Nocardioides sp. W3-2-3]|uniref:hypothetical protein n=1 Tax=Nocardioides convexus TaxID=2712224 RepID=UPI0024183011|nr:hypothetical protein [Nocardioides convexus]NGZ99731.1 hypothetical protein [Nocardioides convexus]
MLGTYALGYLAGRSIATLWSRGPAHEHGVRRIAAGARHGGLSADGAGAAPTRRRAA